METRKPDVITVAVTRVDGGLTIMRVIVNEYMPNPDDSSKRIVWKNYNVTSEYIQSLIDKHVEGGNWVGPLSPVSWRIVPNEFVNESTDDYFRNAWRDAGKHEPEIDMTKAKDIHREKLRLLRNPILQNLDVEYNKADEKGDNKKKKEIAEKKQILRDITNHPNVEAAKTPEELKQSVSHILNN